MIVALRREVPKRKSPCAKQGLSNEVREEGDLDASSPFGRPGNDLLSRVLRRSTIGAGAFHGRVRNGIGCSHPAIITRSAKG
jgi:hypothetical protein